VNKEKRHAFVKMYTRKESVAAHAGMQMLQNDPDIQSRFRQTRWGVGFGPREYHNYENGVSIIPIKLLTEADRKWVVTAEYGGTGGEPLQEQLVVEEPDIEIGAGVSSKGNLLSDDSIHGTKRLTVCSTEPPRCPRCRCSSQWGPPR